MEPKEQQIFYGHEPVDPPRKRCEACRFAWRYRWIWAALAFVFLVYKEATYPYEGSWLIRPNDLYARVLVELTFEGKDIAFDKVIKCHGYYAFTGPDWIEDQRSLSRLLPDGRVLLVSLPNFCDDTFDNKDMSAYVPAVVTFDRAVDPKAAIIHRPSRARSDFDLETPFITAMSYSINSEYADGWTPAPGDEVGFFSWPPTTGPVGFGMEFRGSYALSYSSDLWADRDALAPLLKSDEPIGLSGEMLEVADLALIGAHARANAEWAGRVSTQNDAFVIDRDGERTILAAPAFRWAQDPDTGVLKRTEIETPLPKRMLTPEGLLTEKVNIRDGTTIWSPSRLIYDPATKSILHIRYGTTSYIDNAWARKIRR